MVSSIFVCIFLIFPYRNAWVGVLPKYILRGVYPLHPHLSTKFARTCITPVLWCVLLIPIVQLTMGSFLLVIERKKWNRFSSKMVRMWFTILLRDFFLSWHIIKQELNAPKLSSPRAELVENKPIIVCFSSIACKIRFFRPLKKSGHLEGIRLCIWNWRLCNYF